jgi:hypothetical protein
LLGDIPPLAPSGRVGDVVHPISDRAYQKLFSMFLFDETPDHRIAFAEPGHVVLGPTPEPAALLY